jgi:hypothetical protein
LVFASSCLVEERDGLTRQARDKQNEHWTKRAAFPFPVWSQLFCSGLGQVRTVVGGVADDSFIGASPLRGVQLDRPLTTALGADSIVTIAPNVGRWIVAGEQRRLFWAIYI